MHINTYPGQPETSAVTADCQLPVAAINTKAPEYLALLGSVLAIWDTALAALEGRPVEIDRVSTFRVLWKVQRPTIHGMITSTD